MYKNIKTMFLFTALIFLLVGISTTTASDVDNQTTHEINSENHELTQELSTKTSAQPTIHSNENKNQITKNIKQQMKQEEEKFTTNLELKFQVDPEDEKSGEEYYITHLDQNYTIEIKLTEDEQDTPIAGVIQLYLDEDTEAIEITLNESQTTQQTYTTQKIGSSLIYAVYDGDENYESTTSNYITLDVEQYFPTLTINNIENVCYNSTIEISGTLYNEQQPMNNRNIDIIFNNTPITTVQTDDRGIYSYEYSLENIAIQDNLTVEVIYQSNDIAYADAYERVSFDIEKISNNISIMQISNPTVYNRVNIQGKVTDENNKNYEGTLNAAIKFNNTLIYNNDSINIGNGYYSFDFVPNNAGTYELKLTIPENEYYTQSSKTQNLSIEKTTLTLNLDESYESLVKDNITINGSLKSINGLPMGNVQIEISTDTSIMGTTVTDEEGNFMFTDYTYQEVPEDGFETIYFTVLEDENHYGQTDESTIYLSCRNARVSLQTDDVVKINGTLHMTGQVKDAYDESINPEGTISVYINNQEVKNNIILTDGTYQTTIDILDRYVGQDTILVEAFFIADNSRIYYSNENYDYKYVSHDMLETNINIKTTESYVDNPVNITITLEDENGNGLNRTIAVTIKNNENETVLNLNPLLTNGSVNITFTPQKDGIYNVIAQYDGQDNIYYPTIAEQPFNSKQTDTKIFLEKFNGTIYVNDTITFRGVLKDYSNNTLKNENITVIINTTEDNIEETIQTDERGVFEYNYTPKQANAINFTAILEQTARYYSTHQNITITPQKHNTTTIIDSMQTINKYQSTINIKGRVLDKNENTPVNGSVTIKINNREIDTITLINGEFSKNYTVEEIGKNNNITVTFNENDVYTTSNATVHFDTEALNTIITLNQINTTQINRIINITGFIRDENNNPVGGNLTVKINNYVMENVILNDGCFTFNYTTDNVGTNTINITLQEDELHYHGTNYTNTFTVTRTDLEFKDINLTVSEENKTITISGQITNNNNIPTDNLNVTIQLNNQRFNVTTQEGGLFTFTTDMLKPNGYKVNLEVKQTEYFNKLNQSLGQVVIDKDTPTISLNEIPASTYSSELIIGGNLTDNYCRPLKEHALIVIVQDKQYNITTDNEGKYNVGLNDIDAGMHELNIIVPETDYTYSANLTKSFRIDKDTASIVLNEISNVTPGDTLTISGKLVNSENQNLSNKTITITLNNRTYVTTTNNQGVFTFNISNIKAGTYDINVSFEDSNHEKAVVNKRVDVNKLEVILVVDDVVSRVGEFITLRATLHDQYNNPVSGGNLVFKLNGRTLRTDGRFDTDTKGVLKFKVIDGVVEYTLTADLYLRHGKNITASYSGSYRYESAKSNTAQANIQLRYAGINVTTSINTVKHHENITFIAKMGDVTSNSNKSLLNDNTTVIFKINGVSIKDKQNNIIKTTLKDNTATLNYNITTMAGIDKDYNIRDYTVTAVYENPNYYPVNNRNTTTFNVERSAVNINIQKIKVTGNSLNIKASLTDYLGYDLSGTSKICIKINGVTYKENNVNKYYSIENGQININNIDVTDTKVKSIEIVTGERLAYLSARKTTTDIEY